MTEDREQATPRPEPDDLAAIDAAIVVGYQEQRPSEIDPWVLVLAITAIETEAW